MDDLELLELIELEVSELLTNHGFPSDDIQFCSGSALKALEEIEKNPKIVRGHNSWVDKIHALVDKIDKSNNNYCRYQKQTLPLTNDLFDLIAHIYHD